MSEEKSYEERKVSAFKLLDILHRELEGKLGESYKEALQVKKSIKKLIKLLTKSKD